MGKLLLVWKSMKNGIIANRFKSILQRLNKQLPETCIGG
jgi:hypothetical protein